jgi:hypothetical protein
MQQGVPKYMVAILIITGLYLSVEIPFSIYLVSVLGGVATQADIDTVEKFGRVLTGVAVALAYVGLRTYPNYHAWGHSFGASTRAAIFRIIPIVLLVFFGLHFYGEARGMFSTGDQRKEAFISNLARRTIAEDGTAWVKPSLDPTWLATVSGLPALASSSKMVAMSGLDIEELSRREAIRSVGNMNDAAVRFSEELRRDMSSAYRDFSNGAARFDNVVAGRDSTAEYEWDKFRSRLRSYFGTKSPRPGTREHARVIKELRSEGLPVAGNFNLDDRAAFKIAVMRKITVEAGEQFRQAIEYNVGKGSKLKPSSTEAEFYADPAVQRKVREGLSDLGVGRSVVLRPDMEIGVFEREVYPALLARASAQIYKTATMYAPGFTSQSEREMGEAAFKAATLPATALLLSLAGALFHIYKFSNYLMLIFGRSVRSGILSSNPAAHAFAALALICAVIGMRGGLGKTEAVIPHDGGIYGEVVKAAVSLQPGMFLIGETLAENGPWQLIEGHLPEARHSEIALERNPGISPEQTAAVVPVPEVKTIEFAEVDGFVPPIPLPRPE